MYVIEHMPISWRGFKLGAYVCCFDPKCGHVCRQRAV